MIYGETFASYTQIGGTNMDSGIMAAAEVVGSSPTKDEAGDTIAISLSWKLPGGITGFEHNGAGQWGYLLTAKSNGGQLVADTDVVNWLNTQGVTIDDMQNIDPSQEEAIKTALNPKVADYARRVARLILLQDDKLTEDEKQEAVEFKQYFGNCYTVNID